MSALRTALLGTVLGGAVLGLAALPAEADDSSAAVYSKTVKGTVAIFTKAGTGTGFVVDREKRLVVTANHVVDGEKKVEVVFPMFRGSKVVTDIVRYAAAEKKQDRKVVVVGEVIRTSAKTDLALIRLASLPEQVQPLRLAAQEPLPGHDVHCVGGWPRGSGGLWIYNNGKVRQVYQFNVKSKEKNGTLEARVVEIQSPVNDGDSGGPLVNNAGEVVGVISRSNAEATLVSRAIATCEVRKLLQKAK